VLFAAAVAALSVEAWALTGNQKQSALGRCVIQLSSAWQRSSRRSVRRTPGLRLPAPAPAFPPPGGRARSFQAARGLGPAAARTRVEAAETAKEGRPPTARTSERYSTTTPLGRGHAAQSRTTKRTRETKGQTAFLSYRGRPATLEWRYQKVAL